MSFLDVFLAVFLIIGLIKGLRRGFFVELASLISILLGIYIAIRFSFCTKSYLEQHVTWNPKTIQVGAFAITFLIVIVAVAALARAFTALANFSHLGILNNLLGGLCGILKAILVLSVFINLFQKFNQSHSFLSKRTTENSVLYVPIQSTAKAIFPAIGDWFEIFQSKTFDWEQPKSN